MLCGPDIPFQKINCKEIQYMKNKVLNALLLINIKKWKFWTIFIKIMLIRVMEESFTWKMQ